MSRLIKTGAAVALGAASLAAVPVAPAATVSPSAPKVREFEGTITAVARDPKRFRMRTEKGRVVRIRISRNTRFERISGFSALKRGLAIEVTARKRDGRWIAREVEQSGRDDDNGGGDDDTGADDNGGNRGGGNDDGPNHT